MWDDSDPDRLHPWKLFALALLVSTGAHFAVVEVVPGFGAEPESIALEVTMTFTPAFDTGLAIHPPAENDTRARAITVRRRVTPVITTPAPSNTTRSGVTTPIPQADADKPASVDRGDHFAAPLLPSPGNNSEGNDRTRTVLSPALLEAQLKAATEAYLEEQKQAACSPLARKHALAECPATVGGDSTREVNNSQGTILPLLVPEEHPLTDEELERRANIKGILIPLFKFKFK